jgi:hypothetical protein
MKAAFDRIHEQLRRAVAILFVVIAPVLGITFICAALGLAHAVAKCRSFTVSLGNVFLPLLGLCLACSLLSSLMRRLERRTKVQSTGEP